MPWAALNHSPTPLPGPAQTQRLDLVGIDIGFKAKKKYRETGLLDEEEKATSKRRDHEAEGEPSPTPGRAEALGTDTTCAPYLNMGEDWVLLL